MQGSGPFIIWMRAHLFLGRMGAGKNKCVYISCKSCPFNVCLSPAMRAVNVSGLTLC